MSKNPRRAKSARRDEADEPHTGFVQVICPKWGKLGVEKVCIFALPKARSSALAIVESALRALEDVEKVLRLIMSWLGKLGPPCPPSVRPNDTCYD